MDSELNHLWSVQEYESDNDVEEFEDDDGATQTERVRPIPPPSMGEGRGIATNSNRRLDMHTGAQTWASKNGDVEATDTFDEDLVRPVEQFASVSRLRSAVQVNGNRKGTQEEAEREEFQARDPSMYKGYNELIPRTLRGLVPTRRGVQSLEVTGREKHGGRTERPVEADVRQTLRSDNYNVDDTHVRGKRSGVSAVTSQAKMHMGAYGGRTHAQAPGGRQSVVSNSRETLTPVVLANRQDGVQVDPSNRTTLSANHAAAAADAVLSRWDSVASVQRTNRTVVDEKRPWSADAVLGTADSVAIKPPRPATFDEIAAMASQIALGTQDSRTTIGWDVATRNARNERRSDAAPSAMNRIGPLKGTTSRRSHETEFSRALQSARSRDLTRDPLHVERIVANLMDTRIAAMATTHARRLRNETAPGRAPVATQLHTKRALESERRLGDDAAIASRVNSREQYTRASTTGMHRLSTDQDIEGRLGTRRSDEVLPPVQGTVERRWGDDEGLSASHVPLSAGPMAPPTTQRVKLSEAKEFSNAAARSTHSMQRAPLSMFEQKGTRR